MEPTVPPRRRARLGRVEGARPQAGGGGAGVGRAIGRVGLRDGPSGRHSGVGAGEDQAAARHDLGPRVAAHERGEHEPAQADRQEDVAHAGHVAQHREGDGQDVAQRRGLQQDVDAGRIRQQAMELRDQVGGGHAGGRQGARPDRHPAPVGDHGHGVGGHPDTGHEQARLVAVQPEPVEQDAEAEGEERQAQLLHPLDVQPQRELGAVADDDREEQQERGAEADIKQVRRPTAQQQGEQDPDDHARDQHGVVPRVTPG